MEMISQVKQVLNGKTRDLERTLEEEMTILAEEMRFEEAAAIRNRLQKLREYSSRQKIVTDDPVDRDIIAFAAEDDDACAVILKVRDGKLVGKQHHYLSGVLQMPHESILAYRMGSTEGGVAMPELGKSTIDRDGLAVVERWIAGL